MKKKVVVGILFGGQSVEHEVSLLSAKNVIAALDRKKYRPIPIFITPDGRWDGANNSIPTLKKSVDVIFPVLHGTNGEDGTVQGFLKLAQIPFVGPDVLASAIGMDKVITKRLWKEAGLPVGKFIVVKKGEKPSYARVAKELGKIVFVKPANLGSSVGISKVRNEKEFSKAIRLAFQYDSKILIEEYIAGREIECAVLGNDRPRVSIPGEIIPHHEFYSYEAKYLDENGASLRIPAKLSPRQTKTVQTLARKAFEAIGAEGMARVDFFLRTSDGKFFLNEINTLPGFTKFSMYPKLWEASGVSSTTLVDTIIGLAIDRFRQERKLKTSFFRAPTEGKNKRKKA